MEIDQDLLRNFRFFRGHFYNLLADFLGIELVTITLLRDPVARTISHYRHIKRDPGHYFHQLVQNQDLIDFVQDRNTMTMVWNFQCRSFTFRADPVMVAQGLSKGELAARALERKLVTMMPSSSDALLDQAIMYLESCAHVGLLERFPESLTSLSRVIGFVAPYDLEFRLNVDPSPPKKEEINDETLEAIVKATVLDQKLYQRAEKLLDEQMSGRRMCCHMQR